MSKAGHSSQKPQFLWNWTKPSLASLGVLTLTVTIAAAVSARVPESRAIAADIPVVKSVVLGANSDVPWSQPVKVTDPFEGNYLAVFDRHYFYRRFLSANTRTTVVSLWSPKTVRFLLTDRSRDCFSGHGLYNRFARHGFYGRFANRGFYTSSLGLDCVASNSIREVIGLSVKLGERVFRLEGKNSAFAVSSDLAKALRNSPVGNVDIRLVTRSGETIDSEIGKGTVKAWKAIYQ